MPIPLCLNTFACLKINQYSTGLFVSYSGKNPIAQNNKTDGRIISFFFKQRAPRRFNVEVKEVDDTDIDGDDIKTENVKNKNVTKE